MANPEPVCHIPPALDDDQLNADIDGTVVPAVRAHLAACPACAARREQLAAQAPFEYALRDVLRRQGCPTPAALYDYAMNLLDTTATTRITAHARTCRRCNAEIGWLRESPGTQPFAQPAPMSAPTSDGVRSRLTRILATLFPLAPPPILRGTDDEGDHWSATFPGGQLFAELNAAHQNDIRWRLSGQLLPDPRDAGWAGALVQLHQADTLLAVTTLDSLFEFEIELRETGLQAFALTLTARDGRQLRLQRG